MVKVLDNAASLENELNGVNEQKEVGRPIDLSKFGVASVAACMQRGWTEETAQDFCKQSEFDWPGSLEGFLKSLTSAAHAVGAPVKEVARSREDLDGGKKPGKGKKPKAAPPPAPVPNPEDYKGKEGRKKLQEAVKEAEELPKLPTEKTEVLLERLTAAWAKKHEEELAALKTAGKAPRVSKGGLNGSELRVLEVLTKASNPMTRGQLAELTGMKKGWSKLLGASTREDSPNKGMVGKGLVEVSTDESAGRNLAYVITDAGKEALTKANAV